MSVTGGFSINTNHLGDFDRGDFTIRENLTTLIKGAARAALRRRGVRLSNHITNTFRMDGNFTFNGQLVGRRAGGLHAGPRVDVRSGRWRIQEPEGHAVGLLRPGQLARSTSG